MQDSSWKPRYWDAIEAMLEMDRKTDGFFLNLFYKTKLDQQKHGGQAMIRAITLANFGFDNNQYCKQIRRFASPLCGQTFGDNNQPQTIDCSVRDPYAYVLYSSPNKRVSGWQIQRRWTQDSTL